MEGVNVFANGPIFKVYGMHFSPYIAQVVAGVRYGSRNMVLCIRSMARRFATTSNDIKPSQRRSQLSSGAAR